MSELPQPIREKIDALAGRARRLTLLRGIGVLALTLAAAVLLSFLADYFLRLPQGMRALVLLAIVAALAVVGLRALWRPLRDETSREATALRIEREFPELRDSLISAVQLSRKVDAPDFYHSKDLARQAIAAGAEAVASIDVREAAPAARPLRLFAAGAGAFLLLAALAAASPYHAETYFQRICLLQGVEWRKSVVLAVIEPEGGWLMARGDDFTVRVEVVKGDPEEVGIRSRLKSGGEWEKRPMVRHRRQGRDTYERTFREVPESFTFYVTGGDARTEKYSVEVKVPPSIQEIQLVVDYPSYLGLESKTIPDGNLSAPMGTEVRLVAHASRPLAAAELVLGSSDRQTLAPADGPRGERTMVEASFVVEKSLWYRFELTDDDGFTNSRPIRYRLDAQADRPPRAKILVPGRNSSVTARARIPLEAEVSDDHGLRRVDLVYTILTGYDGSGGEEERIPLPGIPDGAKEATPTLVFELANLSLQLGDRVEYLVEAEDFREHLGPNRGRSPVFTFQVVSEEQIEAGLDERLRKVRDELRRTIRSQQVAQDRIVDALQVAEGGAEVDRSALLQSELAQKKVGQAIDRSARQLDGVAADMEWNLVGDEEDRAWVRGLAGMLDDGALPRSQAAAEALARGRREKDTGVVEGVANQQQEVIAVLERVWRSLDKWTDFREIVRRIRELRDEEEWIRKAIESSGE